MTETTATTGTSAGKAEQKHAEDSTLTEDSQRRDGEANRAEPDRVDSDRASEQPAANAAPAGSGPEPGPGAGSGSGSNSGSSDGGSSRQTGSGRPAYTRPPGMTPPPEQPEELDQAAQRREAAGGVPASAVLSAAAMADAVSTGTFPAISVQGGTYPLMNTATATATAPVSAPPRSSGNPVTVRPIGASAPTAVGSAPVVGVRARPAATPRGPRRARLNVKRIDPWSVMKFSFAVSLVLFVVIIVAASVLYLALDTMGVFSSINNTIAELVDAGGGDAGDTFQITARGVIGTSAVLGALNVLLFTSLATLGAFIYNVCADLVGGVEVTLAERD